MTSNVDITKILRDKAAGHKNTKGNHWADCWCRTAANYIDELRNPQTLYVCHMDETILKIGSREECQVYKDLQHFNTRDWRVSGIEEYGLACYGQGQAELEAGADY